MATLQKIRNKAGLLVIVIGIALLAFIIGDFLNSGQAFFRMSQDKVVVVNGKKVTTQEFSELVNPYNLLEPAPPSITANSE